jgi:RHS repeat-associated protein
MLSPTGSVLTRRRFNWDAADRLIAMEDWHWGTFRYRYDPCGRLISVTGGNGELLEQYRYDATGNLIEGPLAQNVVIGPGNRLLATDDQTFSYDANGNLIGRRDKRNEWLYEWDREGQLRRLWRDGTIVGEYEYDLMSRRIGKQAGGQNIEFLYERYGLRAEIFQNGLHNHYVSLPGLPVPIARFSPGANYYYGFDAIGSPIEMFSETGELVLAVHSHAYGSERREHRPTGYSAAFPFNFMGQYFDGESGLFYNHFRYYEAAFGRYISQDPLTVHGGMNFYIYPPDPNGWIDPLGLMPTFTCMPHWNACQQWYARQKIATINEAMKTRTLTRCKTTCRSGYQGADFRSKRCGSGTYSGQTHAIDHLHDLQASGYDRCCENHRAIGKNFNNDLNVQVNEMFNSNIPKINVGDIIPGKIATTGCMTKGPCSKAGQRQVARKPPGPAKPCPPKYQKPLNC